MMGCLGTKREDTKTYTPSLDDVPVQETGDTTIRLHLQASELQNSVKMLSCALR